MKKSTVLSTLIIFAVLYVLYELIAVRLQQLWFMILYVSLLCVLIFAYFIVTANFPRGEVDPNTLPASWSQSDRELFLSECAKRRRIARPIIMLTVAIACVLLLDMVFLFLGKYIDGFFGVFND